jgi:hypothetical protein
MPPNVFTWKITCAGCRRDVNADVVAGWKANEGAIWRGAASATLWLRCPQCNEGSVKVKSGEVYPVAPAGRPVQNLPEDVAQAWREAGLAHSAGAYTASEMMCRKILMHVAVDRAGSKPQRHLHQLR